VTRPEPETAHVARPWSPLDRPPHRNWASKKLAGTMLPSVASAKPPRGGGGWTTCRVTDHVKRHRHGIEAGSQTPSCQSWFASSSPTGINPITEHPPLKTSCPPNAREAERDQCSDSAPNYEPCTAPEMPVRQRPAPVRWALGIGSPQNRRQSVSGVIIRQQDPQIITVPRFYQHIKHARVHQLACLYETPRRELP